jgi:hypothetical protein
MLTGHAPSVFLPVAKIERMGNGERKVTHRVDDSRHASTSGKMLLFPLRPFLGNRHAFCDERKMGQALVNVSERYLAARVEFFWKEAQVVPGGQSAPENTVCLIHAVLPCQAFGQPEGAAPPSSVSQCMDISGVWWVLG